MCTNIFQLNPLSFPKNWIFLCLVITQGCTISGVEKSRALEQWIEWKFLADWIFDSIIVTASLSAIVPKFMHWVLLLARCQSSPYSNMTRLFEKISTVELRTGTNVTVQKINFKWLLLNECFSSRNLNGDCISSLLFQNSCTAHHTDNFHQIPS